MNALAPGPEKLRERILGEERLERLLLWLAAPLAASAAVNSLYEAADTLWLSRLGPAALGTPTLSWPYRGILMSIGFGVAASSSALIGQYVGAGRLRDANRALGTVAGLLIIVSVLGTLALLAGIPFYLGAIGAPSDIAPLARVYLAAIIAATPFSLFYMLYNFAVAAVGDTRTPMKISAAAALLNFILDPVFIFTLGLGVYGAGLATAAASMASGVYAALDLYRGRSGLRLTPSALVPEKRLLPLVARVSAPLSLQRLGINLGFITMMGIVSGLGTPVVAAYSIGQVVLNIDHVLSMPLARATGIVVAQSLGAGMTQRARRAAITGFKLVLATTLAYTLLLLAARDSFIAAFTSDPHVAAAASRMLLIFGPSIIGFNALILANAVARSSGHTVLVSILGVARLWLLRVPLSYLLAYKLALGDTGLWTGMATSNYATGAAATAWLLKADWAKPIIKTKRSYPTRSTRITQ